MRLESELLTVPRFHPLLVQRNTRGRQAGACLSGALLALLTDGDERVSVRGLGSALFLPYLSNHEMSQVYGSSRTGQINAMRHLNAFTDSLPATICARREGGYAFIQISRSQPCKVSRKMHTRVRHLAWVGLLMPVLIRYLDASKAFLRAHHFEKGINNISSMQSQRPCAMSTEGSRST